MSDPISMFRRDVQSAPKVLARIDEIAAATGITAKTLRNLYYGATDCMRYGNVLKLDEFYRIAAN